MVTSIKVTQDLHETWARQLMQLREERTHDQSGNPLPPEAIREREADIAAMQALLALPVGQYADVRAIVRQATCEANNQ